VTARDPFFENAAHLEFQPIRFGRHTEVEIEKAVVNGLQAQNER
jgi:hypothetical protein